MLLAQINNGPTKTFFNTLNGAIFGNSNVNSGTGAVTVLGRDFSTPRGVISALLPFLFTFAGLILFVMIVWGGFEMLTGAANPKSQEAGKQRIMNAIIGFVILFVAYWLAQILETLFGISIL